MKQRSASLDHPAYGHRRHLQHRATVTIRTPYVTFFIYKNFYLFYFLRESDEESSLPSPVIDLNKTNIKRNTKLVYISSYSFLNKHSSLLYLVNEQ
jgi:hypothetical protein